MKEGTVGVVFGLAGLLLGGAALVFSMWARSDATDALNGLEDTAGLDNESIGSLGEQVRGLQDGVQHANKQIGRVREEERQLRDKVRELIERVEAAEKAALEGRGVRRGDGGGRGVNIGAPTKEELRAKFDALRDKIVSGEGDDDDRVEFWRLARETEVVDDLIPEFEKAAEENPDDPESAFRLAEAYTAKLLSVPFGPERGAWAAKGEQVYRDIIERHPTNWDAQRSLAFSLSQWPPMFPKKGQEAIERYEKLREMQQSVTPDAKHAGTYLELAELYRAKGNVEKAKAVLQDGIAHHPDAETLQQQLDLMTGGNDADD